MHHATSRIADIARRYASQVPLPASAATSGIVAAGVDVGAMVETDCASVSIGESASPRKPYSTTFIFVEPGGSREGDAIVCLSRSAPLGMPYHTRTAGKTQATRECSRI